MDELGQAQPRGVIFDLDGTLYALKRSKMRMTCALWRDIGILRHLSGTRAWLRTRRFKGRKELKKAFFDELGRRSGVSASRAEHWYNERFLKSFVLMLERSARVRPGLENLLLRLRKRSIKLAVLSDYDYVTERLGALGIPVSSFDDVTCAEDWGVLKPSPVPFLALAEKWGVEPKAAIVVGDRRDLDAAGAEAAGMEFLGVRDKARGKRTGRRFKSWPEAVRFLDERTSMPARSPMIK